MSTDNIFKFVSLRPPQLPTKEKLLAGFAKFDDQKKTSFQIEIESLTGDNKRYLAVEAAKKYLLSNSIKDSLDKEIALVKVMAGAKKISDAKKLAKEVLGDDIEDFLKKKAVIELWEKLWNNVYAQALAPDFLPDDRNYTFDGVKALKYLRTVSEMKDNELPPNHEAFQKINLVLPAKLVPAEKPASPNTGSDKSRRKAVDRFKSLKSELKDVQAAIKDLKDTNIRYRAAEQRKMPIEGDTLSQIGKEVFHDFKVMDFKKPLIKKESLGSLSYIKPQKDKTKEIVAISQTSVIVPAKKPWVFRDYGNSNLTKKTKQVLKENTKEFDELEASEIISSLEAKMVVKLTDFFRTIPKEHLGAITALTEFDEITTLIPLPGLFSPIKPFVPRETASERGLKPLGIGDLLVVKQELQKYTAGEIAHIENVLQSESKTRLHSRIRESEEILIQESEEIEESERDLQTTERFELHREAEKTIETEKSVEAGMSITASYGVVTATVHGDFAFNRSTTEAKKNSTDFAKEVIDKSVSKIQKKSREERIKRTLERIEETNEHTLDNKDGEGHVTGIYRWVDKHYKARVINYGKRLMMEFVVPEPAAFYIHTQSGEDLEGVTLKKPKPPKIWGHPLKPIDLTKHNYTNFIKKYNVQDVSPYPDEIVRVSAAVAGAPGEGSGDNAHFAETSDKLVVPDGYQAIDLYGEYALIGNSKKDSLCDILVGGEHWGRSTAWGIEGIIPISLIGYAYSFHFNVTAKCEIKLETISAWQIETFQAIMNAYEEELAEYNEQVAAAQMNNGVNIQGRNPGFNRKIEQEELRKGALRILTNNFKKTKVSGMWRHNEEFNAMQDAGDYGYPEFQIPEAQTEGKIIQFFEQAFEWNNMTYRFYPYFWGRKADWDKSFDKEDTDTHFTDFLRAGAARVLVPAHPAYTEAVLHYMHTNEIWNGGEPPTLDDPLFLSIVDEIKSDNDADINADLVACSIDSGYPCLSDEWDVKVPTSLVYLQQKSDLPDLTESAE